MSEAATRSPSLLLWALLAAGFSVLAGLVFAGWLRFGPEIFLTYAENGLSLCF